MIINENIEKLSIIANETDLLNYKINKIELISSSFKLQLLIKKLCKNYPNLNFNKFNIYTYKFKIFKIEIYKKNQNTN